MFRYFHSRMILQYTTEIMNLLCLRSILMLLLGLNSTDFKIIFLTLAIVNFMKGLY